MLATVCARSLPAIYCFVAASGWSLAGGTVIEPVENAAGQTIGVCARPLPSDAVQRLAAAADPQQALGRVLSVSVDDDRTRDVSIAGLYELHGSSLFFTPRFAFRPGQRYRAVLHQSELSYPEKGPAADLSILIGTPADEPRPATEVTAIFPSASVLPENQLRFYLHFSQPMGRGRAYENIVLLDGQGRKVDLPFLELGEELWDPEQRRLTLLIDPGRIKRGVLPREALGTVLRRGEQYTLVVRPAWHDAREKPLARGFEKHFQVGPPREAAIEPQQWRIARPQAGTRDVLAIDFPQPLDRALLERAISLCDAGGRRLAGELSILREERRWELRPDEPWRAGKYELVIDSALEDLAGNRIGRPFEVDRLEPITRQIENKPTPIRVEIGSIR